MNPPARATVRLWRGRFFGWLLLAGSLGGLSAQAQIVGMADNFTYTTADITGHAPTTGTGTWSTTYTKGTGNSIISTNGSAALIKPNAGVQGAGSAVAQYAFTPVANAIYTMSGTFSFTGPIGSGATDCWVAVGISNATGGGGGSTNNGPWINLRPQTTAGTSTSLNAHTGSTSVGSATVPSADYAAPITVAVTWNTFTGQVQYYLNGALLSTLTTTTTLPSGSYYAFFEGYKTGTFASCSNITLTSQSAQATQMQDNFNYVVSDLNGQAPTTTVAGTTWNCVYTNAKISTDGTQALLVLNNGTPGLGQATANYAFLPAANTFYTLRITFSYKTPVGSSVTAGAAFGFSSATTGGNVSTNNAPWMNLPAQGTTSSTPTATGYHGTATAGTSVLPTADYGAPLTATITWNTSTGQAQYYIENLYQSAWSATVLPTAGKLYNAFFQANNTGSDVNVENITLTSQSFPLPTVVFGPNSPENGSTVPADFANIFTLPNTQWASAQSHTNAMIIAPEVFTDTSQNIAAIANFYNTTNVKLMVPIGMLQRPSDGSCGDGEGYNPLSKITNEMNGIKNAGVNLTYVTFDEPLTFGVENNVSWNCHLSMATAAAQVANSVAVIQAVFPNVQFIDTEVLDPEDVPPTDIANWITALKTAGVTVVAFHDDLHSEYPENDLLPTISVINAAGLPFGATFLGRPFLDNPDVDTTLPDSTYMDSAMENIQIYNASELPQPPPWVRLQNWDGDNPMYALPDSSPTAWSYMVNYFFDSPYATQPPPVECHMLQISYQFGPFFYTTSASEYASFLAKGYVEAGTNQDFGVYPNAGGAAYLVPLYRLYNAATNAYAYTPDAAEKTSLLNAGFVLQETQGYVWPNSTTGSAQGGFALYGCSKSGQYFYTLKQSTYSGRVGSGWTPAGNNPLGSGIVCYVMPRWSTTPNWETAESFAASPFTFTAPQSGLPPNTYQWYLNGVAISGATGSSYTAISSNGGVYSVTVGSAGGASDTYYFEQTIIPGAALSTADTPTLPPWALALLAALLLGVGLWRRNSLHLRA